MRFDLTPGNAVGCTMNAHRSNWAGQVCRDAASWACGAPQEFRESYCAANDERCYHVHAFDPREPRFVVNGMATDWIFGESPDALDDQILILWSKPAQEPHGIRSIGFDRPVVCGAYRVKASERIPLGYRSDWVVRPHPDGWARFHHLRLQMPRFEEMAGQYIKQIAGNAVRTLFEDAIRRLADPAIKLPDEDRTKLEHFAKHVQEWLERGAERMRALMKATPAASTPKPSGAVGAYPMLRDLKSLLKAPVRSEAADPIPAAAGATPAPAIAIAAGHGGASTAAAAPARTRAALASENGRPGPLPEEPVRARLLSRHRPEVVTAIQVSSLSKPLLLLRGRPGVGKSDLAVSLLDDAARERTLVVVVSSTWRGREDLLGFVNPIHHCFEPMPFTHFLRAAQRAWDAGDHRIHLVVFEEFNLSQPEHWLSELLVRSQMPDEDRRGRTIQLGGEKVRDWGDAKPEVYLSPALRMVGTINNDHTVRLLSPRVLDRAAVIELKVSPREALEKIGVPMQEPLVEAVEQLDLLVAGRGASFSFRTAISLKNALAHAGAIGLDANAVVDLVLVQEVLSKVRLSFADPLDVKVSEELSRWSAEKGSSLLHCARTISNWRNALEEHTDVQQA